MQNHIGGNFYFPIENLVLGPILAYRDEKEKIQVMTDTFFNHDWLPYYVRTSGELFEQIKNSMDNEEDKAKLKGIIVCIGFFHGIKE